MRRSSRFPARAPRAARPFCSIALASLWLGTAFSAHAASAPIDEATGSFYPAAEPAATAPAVTLPGSPTGGVVPPAEQTTARGRATALPAPAEAPVIALLDFETSTLSRQDDEALSEALWGQLHLTGSIRLLPRAATRRWLIANDLHPFMPYAPHIPMTTVLSRLNAKYLVTGRIDRVDNTYALELTVYGAGSEVPILQDAGTRVASLDQMLALMNTLAGEVVGAVERKGGERLGVERRPGGWTQMPVAMQPDDDGVPAGAERMTAGAVPIKTSTASKSRVAGASGMRVIASDEGAAAPKPAAAPTHAENTAPHAAPEQATPREAATHAEPVATHASTPEPTPTPEATPEPTPEATATPVATPSPTPEPTPAGANEAAQAKQLYTESLALPVENAARQDKLAEAVRLAPDNATYSQQLAFDYFQLKRYEDCVKLCDAALKQTPRDSKLLMIKGSAQIALGQWGPAVESCRASVEADPGNDFARYNLALALEMQKSPEAVAAWNDFLAKAGNSPDPQIQVLIPEAKTRLAALEKATH